jgi:ABC-2 type transport system ATP-binding protein
MRIGHIIQDGTPSQLRQMLAGRILELTGNPVPVLLDAARQDVDVQDAQRFGDRLHLRINIGKAGEVRHRLSRKIKTAGGEVHSIQEIPPLLEDVFIDLAGAGTEGRYA